MTRTQKTLLITAAITGLMAGGAALNACAQDKSPGTNAPSGDTGKHTCKGKNSCKGQGGCQSGDNGCKGRNSCKGKGGCNTKGG